MLLLEKLLDDLAENVEDDLDDVEARSAGHGCQLEEDGGRQVPENETEEGHFYQGRHGD